MSTNNVPGITRPTKQSPTTNTKPNRLPAPTLFVGPPSRNASQLSISRTGTDPNTKSGRPAANQQKTNLSRIYNANGDGARDEPPKENEEEESAFQKPSEKSIDAKWREMQNTLNEVELTAQSSTHVFGQNHAKALDDLRNAQVALAKAWGRGSEEKVKPTRDDVEEINIGRFSAAEGVQTSPARLHRQRKDTEASASTVLSDESDVSEGSAKSGKSQLEDETAQDIKLASERRAANEAYFKKVDEGVKEVVERLEKVAEAMRGVEGESRSLWSNSDRSGSDSELNKQTSVPATASNG